MNTGGIQKRVLKKVGHLELSILVDIDTYTNKDMSRTRVEPVRYLMSGGKYGDHSLSLDSSTDRLSAHWKGYLQVNEVDINNLKLLIKRAKSIIDPFDR